MKIHTGDFVLVISGKDKGKTGSVLRVLGDRLVVSDINMRTRHVRKTDQGAGQRLRYEASISASNVMVLDPKSKKPTRVGVKVNEKGKKVRIAKVSGEVLVAGKVAAKKGPKAAPVKKGAEGSEQTETVSAPPKKPFWKRLSFGAEAAAEEVGDSKARPTDHSVPEQARTPESFSHSRGS